VERFGWGAFTLAEDVEYHLHLVEAGIRVAYAAEANVMAELPVTLRQSRSQNVRWDRGRLQMLRAYGPRLLLNSIRRGDLKQLDAVAEQLVPPFSLLTGQAVLALALTTALRQHAARRLATLVAIGQIGYVVTGLRLVRAGPRAYLALLFAPIYIGWKLWVYALAAAGLRNSRWIRTFSRN
jgi:cellulose synthase/poly-beta-1,6-N-acetylglucosamine synthase-like glycosyltransferase